MKWSPDWYAVTLSQGALAVVLLMCIFRRAYGALKASIASRQGSSANLTVSRGERSMNGLFTMYGVATVAFSLSVEVSTVFAGSKAALILGDYVVLSYLFFSDLWFRNRVVFNLLGRMSKD